MINQGDNSVVMIDDKDTINKTKNVNVTKVVEFDLSVIEKGQTDLIEELTKLRKSQERHNNSINKKINTLISIISKGKVKPEEWYVGQV